MNNEIAEGVQVLEPIQAVINQTEWRKNENEEDHRNSNGIPEIAFPSMDLLKHGLSVYTIEAYNIFEQEFIDGAACNYEEVQEKYLQKRWCKTIEECQSSELIVGNARKEDIQCSSIWKMQMIRKMNTLITASQMNTQARVHYEEYFNKLKELVEQEVGSIYVEENVASKQMDSSRKILNPVGSKPKGERNKRKKSIVEKKCKQAKSKKRDLKSSNGTSTSGPVSQARLIVMIQNYIT
ncbi:hypothetical protein Cgig2_016581 [Carnegiea gigantea]|uniref:Protein FAR1-RELATED SEQUENCE n=1 Tax=Carnegiea gigantea TaxID=171969 RepID=A0A9Q1KY17_9CARY|nr:hypothetical protein Cgig2_016581 [Carnegiea gigantea]